MEELLKRETGNSMREKNISQCFQKVLEILELCSIFLHVQIGANQTQNDIISQKSN